MRSIGFALLALLLPSLFHANNINISSFTSNGSTLYFLQAGSYTLEKDAKLRQKELASTVKQPIEIRNLGNKKIYLVQIGPINDYNVAKALKEQLSQKSDDKSTSKNAKQITQQSPQAIAQPMKNAAPVLPVQSTPPAAPGPNTTAKEVSIESTTSATEPVTISETEKTLPPNSKLWNLRNADIRAVIAEISRVTGKNFVIDPRVQGKISVVSSTPMSNKELYQVFLSILQVSGYAAIPNGDIIKIVPNIDAKTLTPDGHQSIYPPKGDDMMVAVVPVHYVSSEQLVPVLRPLMPQWSSVSAYAPSNMLILSGRANNIKSLANIIKQVDSSTANGIDMVQLKHALAMDVATTLKDLIKTQPNAGGRSQITIAADDRSNSLLVSGTKTDRIRLRMLILKLDKRNNDGLNSNTQVVYLNYLRAEDLVPILAGIASANFSGNVGTTIGTITRPALDSTNPASNLAGNSQTSGASSSTTGGAGLSSGGGAPSSLGASSATSNTTAASSQNEGSTKPTVQIIAEPNTNSIIINAPATVIRILKNVITQLDIKPAQLLIEALVAEVNQNDVNSLGIEWGSNAQTGAVGSFRPGFAILNNSTSIADFQAQIYALARENKANILSTPSVVVLDNRQAKILVGKQVSIASTSYPNNAGGTTTASPFTTFDRVNVALHLYVRPQITRGQGIQMQIDQGNDTIDAASSLLSSGNPTFSISSIVTSVHVESGDIVVLGGLTQDSLGNENNRLPILGEIPGLGRLFQRNITNRDKRVLMVFIKPIILRTEQDNLHVTDKKYTHIRQEQLDWIRSQEVYEETNKETILPPLKTKTLPIPFTRPPVVVAPPARKPVLSQVTK